MNYKTFLENKIIIAEDFGVDIDRSELTEILKPHQKDIVTWVVKGGRRAIFASFGLGKTMMQLEVARLVIKMENKPFLICMPLGVVGEFKADNEKLGTGHEIEYITETDHIHLFENKIYVTNYERVRMGDIDPTKFGGVSFDEASILRNLQTETTNYVLKYFRKVKYRFVATATPTPNDFIEILNYADYLGVVDRGHALTRFFQRDTTKAGSLTLYPNKKEEFWKWVSTWAVFINKPSDLGHDDTGYNLPKLNVHEVEVDNSTSGIIKNKRGEIILFKDTTKSLVDVSREKADSIELRCQKLLDLVDDNVVFTDGKAEQFVVFCDRNEEQTRLEQLFKVRGFTVASVHGGQTLTEKERLINDWKAGKYDIILSKKKIIGSGANLQQASKMFFVGIDFKFNDFIQAIHRIFRFGQLKESHVWLVFTQNEREVLKTLFEKWRKHIELQTEMINLVREYGLNSDKIKSDMKRQMFNARRMAKVAGATVFNNDTVLEHEQMEDNSTDMILTSIPFGDHYEYSDNYNDFGHNHGNDNFFKQMDFLTPHLLRTLRPGRIAAIHVKDRIRYSYQNGTSFTTIADFSGQTVAHFVKHGFHLVGKITVTTDVVRENNQTYRLGWSEQCKDATTKGVGMPEYILLFRKAPTEGTNSYADHPVTKLKSEYTRANWQLDAHAYWRSNGNRFLSSEELKNMPMDKVYNFWKAFNSTTVYDFKEHLRICEELEGFERLSALFMSLPTTSNNEMVWTDINRMNTLNANQVNRKKEKHICPLQLDIIERLLYRFTNPDEIVDDPFGGLFSTAYKAIEMGRKAISCELNPEYYNDGLYYLKSIEYKISVPTLFDVA